MTVFSAVPTSQNVRCVIFAFAGRSIGRFALHIPPVVAGDQDKPEVPGILSRSVRFRCCRKMASRCSSLGAILLHIAAKSEALMPVGTAAQARATQWLIAALNSVEPALVNFFLADVVFADEKWAKISSCRSYRIRKAAPQRPFRRTR